MSNRTALVLTPELLLRAYAAGIFPMADSATATDLRWYDPPTRAIIPLDNAFHLPRSLVRTLARRPYAVTLNHNFESVMRGCAEPRAGRETTWINEKLIEIYSILHRHGHAHAIEVWEDNALIGGLYGVALGRAFFGESMFSRKTDASKIALAHLVALLRHGGYTLLDTQFQTPHLTRFGTFEIPRADYHARLAAALQSPAAPFPASPDWDHLLSESFSRQPVTQIS